MSALPRESGHRYVPEGELCRSNSLVAVNEIDSCRTKCGGSAVSDGLTSICESRTAGQIFQPERARKFSGARPKVVGKSNARFPRSAPGKSCESTSIRRWIRTPIRIYGAKTTTASDGRRALVIAVIVTVPTHNVGAFVRDGAPSGVPVKAGMACLHVHAQRPR
jgi:hypothetical protein